MCAEVVLGNIVLGGLVAVRGDAAHHVALRTTDHTCPLVVVPAARGGSTHTLLGQVRRGAGRALGQSWCSLREETGRARVFPHVCIPAVTGLVCVTMRRHVIPPGLMYLMRSWNRQRRHAHGRHGDCC